MENGTSEFRVVDEKEGPHDDARVLAQRDAGRRLPAPRSGGVADFHALRHTFITNLARSGVHPKTAQALARHSTITLTMDRYSHSLLEDHAAAVGRLPDLAQASDQEARATGTDDAAHLAEYLASEAGAGQTWWTAMDSKRPLRYNQGRCDRGEVAEWPNAAVC